MVILTSLGTWGLPQMIHKFYTIRSEKAIATGTVISTLFAVVISGGSYFLGGFGRLFDSPAIYNGNGSVAYDTIIPAMLSGLPDLLIGIVVMLVLSASMSTLSSLVLTSSSTLTLDFIKGCLVKNMKDKTQLVLMQCLIVAFIVLSVVLALDPPDFIAQLMGISWGALAGASWPLPLRSVLEKDHPRCCVGQLCHRHRNHCFKYVPALYCVPHQCRCCLHDCGTQLSFLWYPS